MSIDRQRLRWNGWGWMDAPDVLGDKAEVLWAWMGRALGVDPLPSTPATPLEAIALAPSRLEADHVEHLARMTSPARVMADVYERAFHARGKSYHDLLYLRAGHLEVAPDLVVYPASTEETLALVQYAAAEQITVVPFGGGSSVVGGVNALAGPDTAGVMTLDMTLMGALLGIDETSRVARAEAGIYGPKLEELLQAQGYTLGHYPQSFEFSTLGGWIAPRSAGHQSNKYGKAESWLVEATLATPRGLWVTEGFPGSAAGPQGRDIVAGSEGLFGVITEAAFKVHPVPEVKDYRGYIFPDFNAGVAANRALCQAGVPTAMIRLSDAPETFFYNALDAGGVDEDSGPLSFCLMLVGLEGEAAEVEAEMARSRAIIEAHGGMHMGETPGTKWYEGRFEMPYLRDPMMERGLGVDTLETATDWANLITLHDATTQAIREAIEAHPARPGAKGIVMSHVSHSYRNGASLYFTFVFPRQLEDEVGQWMAIKHAASECIVQHGGTISHHHGVGVDHLPWIAQEKGPVGMALLEAMKQAVDPAGILNPGKLLP